MHKKGEMVYEYWHNDFKIGYRAEEVLIEEKTDLQDLVLLENNTFGKILLLDGNTQLTERDVHIYHEIIVHCPLLSLESPTNILVIGGGDGGVAKEVLKYPNTQITVVEIDQKVVDFSKKYLHSVCGDSFESDRLNLIIDDGVNFVNETDDKFDLIIIDATDPEGPAGALYQKPFLESCKKILNDQGVLLTHCGLAHFEQEHLSSVYSIFSELFLQPKCFTETIPCYTPGKMSFVWGSDKNYTDAEVFEKVSDRYKKLPLSTKYYNPEVHKAAFSLPNDIKNLLHLL